MQKPGLIQQTWDDSLYIGGVQAIISKYICIISLKIVFVLANSVDPGEIP